MPLREWVREDVGLLDDDRYIRMPDNLLATWEVLMKITGRLAGEKFKDREQMIAQLRRYGRPKPAAGIAGLDALGWIVDVPDGGVRLRGWEKYQLRFYRGPSDDPFLKAERNRQRPTTDAARRESSKTFHESMAEAGFDAGKIGRNAPANGLDKTTAVAVDSDADGQP